MYVSFYANDNKMNVDYCYYYYSPSLEKGFYFLYVLQIENIIMEKYDNCNDAMMLSPTRVLICFAYKSI